MTDVCISWYSADEVWVQKLGNAIRQAGYDVIWDAGAIIAQNRRSALRALLQSAKAVIVVWSQGAISEDEIQDIADDAKKRGALVHVLKDEVELPYGFRSDWHNDLSRWQFTPDDAAFKRLLINIAALAPPISAPEQPLKKQSHNRKPNTSTKPPSGAEAILVAALVAIPGLVLYHLYSPSPHLPPKITMPPRSTQLSGTEEQTVQLSGTEEQTVQTANNVAANAQAEDAKAQTAKSATLNLISASHARVAALPELSGTDYSKVKGKFVPEKWIYHGEQDGSSEPNGLGIKEWTSGCPGNPAAHHDYEGQFLKGHMEGFGVYHNCGMTTYYGSRTGDKADGDGVVEGQSGVYSGLFSLGIPKLGVKIYPPGDAIHSEAGSQGERGLEGFGIVVCSDGSLWRAQWSGGHIAGIGVKYSRAGKAVERGTFDQSSAVPPAKPLCDAVSNEVAKTR